MLLQERDLGQSKILLFDHDHENKADKCHHVKSDLMLPATKMSLDQQLELLRAPSSFGCLCGGCFGVDGLDLDRFVLPTQTQVMAVLFGTGSISVYRYGFSGKLTGERVKFERHQQ